MRKHHTTFPRKSINLLLLIDKQGYIGKALLPQLQNGKNPFSVVFATESFQQKTKEEVFFFPYRGHTLPIFPDGKYTHILVVYNGEDEVLASIPGFGKKAKEEGALFLVVVPLRFCTKEHITRIQKFTEEAVVMCIGDIFGKDILDKKTLVGSYLIHAKEEERIVISGMGLSQTYPIFITDVTEAIATYVRSPKKKSGIFFAFPKYPATALSLARMIQKVEPLVRIDFTGESKEENTVLPEGGEYLFDSYPLEQRIRSVFQELTDKEFVIGEASPFIEEEAPRRKTRFVFLRLLLFFVVLFLLPFFTNGFALLVGAYTINQAEKSLIKGDSSQSSKYLDIAFVAIGATEKTFPVMASEANFVGQTKITSFFEENLSLEKTSAQIVQEVGNIVTAWKDKNGVVVDSDTRQAIALLQTIRLQKEKLPFVLPQTAFLSGILGLTNDLAGFERTKTYLVLFQNNMELRPGGGFIGSYGIAHVNEGTISFSVHDVYDADGQLKGHVEPPFAIRRYLPSEHWYLRDSNFSPDFPTNASSSAFFLSQETGETPDAVIAIDLSFVKMLVGVLGKVQVVDYNETVTKDNLYSTIEKHAERNFFPGSSQKKDFLTSLFQSMQTQFMQNNIPYKALYQVMLDGFSQKHLLVAFPNASSQNVFTVNNMSSSLVQGNTQDGQGKTIADFLGLSEANLGVNKVNYSVNRKVSQDMIISKEGTVSGRLTIVYHNASATDDYKNYLRVIVPLGTKIQQIVVDGLAEKIVPAVTNSQLYEAKRFVPPQGLEVSQDTEQGKLLVGFLLIIPKTQQETIIVSYTLPDTISPLDTAFTYSGYYFKQPGTDSYPYTFSLSYPDSISLVDSSEGTSQKGGKILLEKNLLQDQPVLLHFVSTK